MLCHHENQNEKNQKAAPGSAFQDTKEVFTNGLALQFEIAEENAEQTSFYLSAYFDCIGSCPASHQFNDRTMTDLNVSRAEF